MNNSHKMVLKEITDELELSMISGSFGSRDWGTGAQAVWSTIVGVVSGKSCSWPGGFYGPGHSTPTGSGTCVPPGWNLSAGRYCVWDRFNDNDICY